MASISLVTLAVVYVWALWDIAHLMPSRPSPRKGGHRRVR